MADWQISRSLIVPADIDNSHENEVEKKVGVQAEFKGSIITLVESSARQLFEQSQTPKSATREFGALSCRSIKVQRANKETSIDSAHDTVNVDKRLSEARIKNSPQVATAADFWGSLIENNTRIIIGLNSSDYQLQASHESWYGSKDNHFIVTKEPPLSVKDGHLIYEKKLVGDKITSTKFTVESNHIQGALRTVNSQQVNAINFNQWPDSGIITQKQLRELVETINSARMQDQNGLGEILVHSSIQDGRSEAVVVAEKLFQLNLQNKLNKETLNNTVDALVAKTGPISRLQQELLQGYGRMLLGEG
ncbi:protein-tyrosine phosphatase family protein [Spartinivicinus poritis]|uniref:Protein-tyrosine phosphatase family protein n=1 Tax=Spartinivicinus poritis TaxID=2994640 RepID=A0ABT5UGS0_9GAMM|nr:protein-tyrosine phosphatase family protein [Spartinivicinus sp. A2-2]MDE1465594.1 protein-tyrosine phosphatase family protein [Spartinivicinus sp. A2-2]